MDGAVSHLCAENTAAVRMWQGFKRLTGNRVKQVQFKEFRSKTTTKIKTRKHNEQT